MLLIAALALNFVRPSAACLDGYPTVSEEYRLRSAVFIGTVIRERHEPATAYFDQPGMTYMVRVDEGFKGHLGRAIELFSENTNGEFPMNVGRKYLLFAYGDHGRRIVDNCGNSEMFNASSPKLKEVRALAGA